MNLISKASYGRYIAYEIFDDNDPTVHELKYDMCNLNGICADKSLQSFEM